MPAGDPMEPQRPTARRPFFSASRVAFGLLMAVVAPAMVAFAWQRGVATLADDSVSYITLALHMLPGTDPHVERWVAWRATYPPVFPLLLAVTGGASDLLVGHLVVAACAILGFFAVRRYAALALGSDAGALAVAALFALAPNTWIAMKGILSEPLFLCVSLATLAFFRARLEGTGGSRPLWIAFGVLLALCVLTRAAGAALVLGFAIHAAVRWARTPRRAIVPVALAAAPVVVLTAAWLLLRPHGATDSYQAAGAQFARAWMEQPLANGRFAANVLANGWIASFMAHSAVGGVARGVLGLLGFLALAGAARNALRNRLDGWYVLVATAVTFFWVFGEDNTRRLLYPLVPVALVQAAELVVAAVRAVPSLRLRPVILAAAALLPAAVCLPAMVVLADKARDRAPAIAGSHYAYADIVDYYTTIQRTQARFEAAHTLAVLAGLEALRDLTPPEAKVMWVRPEYVAVLGGREGEPYYFSWSHARRDREVLERRVDYIVRSWVYKTDLDTANADAIPFLEGIDRYCDPVAVVDNPAARFRSFMLMKVDRARLERVVAQEKG